MFERLYTDLTSRLPRSRFFLDLDVEHVCKLDWGKGRREVFRYAFLGADEF